MLIVLNTSLSLSPLYGPIIDLRVSTQLVGHPRLILNFEFLNSSIALLLFERLLRCRGRLPTERTVWPPLESIWGRDIDYNVANVDQSWPRPFRTDAALPSARGLRRFQACAVVDVDHLNFSPSMMLAASKVHRRRLMCYVVALASVTVKPVNLRFEYLNNHYPFEFYLSIRRICAS